jgi:hypothetical protein
MSEFDPKVLAEKPYPPAEEFQKRARVRSMEEYEAMYRRALDDPEGFWLSRPNLWSGSRRRQRRSNGILRSPNGFWAGS